jgi:hypothetical protein
MDISLTTPSLLIPAGSLLLLAYTNRFLALAGAIRRLHADYKTAEDPNCLRQIHLLRRRIQLVRNMQFSCVLSLLLCTICMGLIFFGMLNTAVVVFTISMLVMMASLLFSLAEIQISVKALDLHLQDVERLETKLMDDQASFYREAKVSS